MTRKRTHTRRRTGGRDRSLGDSKGFKQIPGRTRIEGQKGTVRQTLLERAKKNQMSSGGWWSRHNLDAHGSIYIAEDVPFMKVYASDRAWVAEALMADTWSNVRADTILVDDYVGIFRATYTGVPTNASQQTLDTLRYDGEHAFKKMFGDNVAIIDVWYKDEEFGFTAVAYNQWNGIHYDDAGWVDRVSDTYSKSDMIMTGEYAERELRQTLKILDRKHTRWLADA
jgi:hypothetical protein